MLLSKILNLFKPNAPLESKREQITSTAPDYTIKYVDLCVLPSQNLKLSDFNQGTKLTFRTEPSNTYDREAVRFYNLDGIAGGYLFRSEEKDHVYEFLREGNFVSGEILCRNLKKGWNQEMTCSMQLYFLHGNKKLWDSYFFWDSVDTKLMGARIRQMRAANKLSQAKLAAKCNLNAGVVQQYDSGCAWRAKKETVCAIAEALNVEPAWLLGLTNDPSKSASLPGD